MTASPYVLALAGGVGGTKLASAFAQLLGERLTVLVDTGDDFEHPGFRISTGQDRLDRTGVETAPLS